MWGGGAAGRGELRMSEGEKRAGVAAEELTDAREEGKEAGRVWTEDVGRNSERHRKTCGVLCRGAT